LVIGQGLTKIPFCHPREGGDPCLKNPKASNFASRTWWLSQRWIPTFVRMTLFG